MFLSPVCFYLGRHTKRIFTTLVSSSQSGYELVRTKSPTKDKFRMSLRKYDPFADRHVQKHSGLDHHSKRYARLTGRGLFERMITRVKRDYEYGRYYKLWNERAPGLATAKGVTGPRINRK